MDILLAEEISVRIPVAELCKIEGLTPTYYFALAREGRAPKSERGVPLEEARKWLAKRAAQRQAKVAAVRSLRECLDPNKSGTSGSPIQASVEAATGSDAAGAKGVANE